MLFLGLIFIFLFIFIIGLLLFILSFTVLKKKESAKVVTRIMGILMIIPFFLIFTFAFINHLKEVREDNIVKGPLYLAIEREDLEEIQQLIRKKYGVNYSNSDFYGHTPLTYACELKKWDIIEFLIEEGADVNIKTDKGNSPLSYISYTSSSKSIEYSKDMISLLLSKGADPENVIGENTILHNAVKAGNLELAEYILSLNIVDINYRGSSGNTVLHNAAYKRNTQMVKFLLERGADVNILNDDNENPLYIVSEWFNYVDSERFLPESEDIFYILIKNGADINNRSDKGYNVLYNVRGDRNKKYYNSLVELGVKF